MIKTYFVTGIVVTGVLTAWMGCSSSSGSAGTGAGTTSSGTGTKATSSATGTASTGSAGGTTTSSGSVTTSSGSATTSSGSASTSSSTSGGTGGATGNPLECTVPTTPPSGGSCVTTVPENDAGTGVECNPVTNSPCAAADECDGDADNSGNSIGFVCFPGPNDATICGACDNQNGPFCGAGLTCFDFGGATPLCAKYCCTDADCGAGKCTTSDSSGSLYGPLAPNLGVCTTM
jgi:hypothetical protein